MGDYTRHVRALLSQIVSPRRIYAEIYARMKDYNEAKPVHKSTGLRYTTLERQGFQRKNMETLEELAKLKKVDGLVTFHLFQRVRISMSVEGKVYRLGRM